MRSSKHKQKSHNSSIQLNYRFTKTKKSVYQQVHMQPEVDKLFQKIFPKKNKVPPIKTTRNSVYSNKKISVHVSPKCNTPDGRSYFLPKQSKQKSKGKVIKKKKTEFSKQKQQVKINGISELCLLKLKQLDKRSRQLNGKPKQSHKHSARHNNRQHNTEITEFMNQKNIQKLRNSFSKIFKDKKEKIIPPSKMKDNQYYIFS